MTEPGAQHSLGLLMLSEFFKRAGWNVTVGVPQDVAEFKRLFQSEWFDAVGVSISSDRQLDALASLLPSLRQGADNVQLRLFVGGPMALLSSQLLKGLAADVVREDAPATVAWLEQRMTAGALHA